jgi:hypothetical protein
MATRQQAARKASAKNKPSGKLYGTATASAKEKRDIFIAAYNANGRNGTQAAISAGFAVKSANVTANKLLKEEYVKNAIAVVKEESIRKYNLTKDSVLMQLAAMVNFDLGKLEHSDGRVKKLSEMDEETRLALSSMEVNQIGGEDGVVRVIKYKAFDKLGAVSQAMKHLGLMPKEGGVQVAAMNVFITNDDLRMG